MSTFNSFIVRRVVSALCLCFWGCSWRWGGGFFPLAGLTGHLLSSLLNVGADGVAWLVRVSARLLLLSQYILYFVACKCSGCKQGVGDTGRYSPVCSTVYTCITVLLPSPMAITSYRRDDHSGRSAVFPVNRKVLLSGTWGMNSYPHYTKWHLSMWYSKVAAVVHTTSVTNSLRYGCNFEVVKGVPLEVFQFRI